MILIYPDILPGNSKIIMMLDYLHYPYTYDVNVDYDIVFNSNIKVKHKFDLETDKYIINRYCEDVSKQFIADRWARISGNDINIDPHTFMGYCVEKPNLLQGANTGNIVKCPCKPRKDYVYQRIVDTRMSETEIVDYRLVIMNFNIIMIIAKRRSITNLFGNEYGYELVEDVFTEEEKKQLVEFSIFFDYAELDVLRSNFDGNIYVVDVNNLPGYGYFRDKKLLDYTAEEFKKHFL